MTDRAVGSSMIVGGIILIVVALVLGSYLRVLEMMLGVALVAMGFLLRRNEAANSARPGTAAAETPREEPLPSAWWPDQLRQQSDEERGLHDAFAVVQEDGRLRAVHPAEVDRKFAPVLARWRHHLRSASELSDDAELRRSALEWIPDLRRDVVDLENYLNTLVFKRQSAQEHYHRKIDELDALLHAAGELAPMRTLIFNPRRDVLDGWHDVSDQAGSAGDR